MIEAAEAAVKEAILNGIRRVLLAGGEGGVCDAVFDALLQPEIRWALAELGTELRVEFVSIPRNNDESYGEPRGYCAHCRRLIGVTDRRGIGLADRGAYEDSKAKGLGAYLVAHDVATSTQRCPGGGKRIHV